MAPRARPPEFLSTHPGYETRVQNIRSFLPEALSYYQPSNARLETLPTPESLDTPAAKSERELLKRIEAINRAVEQQNGERAVVEALAYELRLSPQAWFRSASSSRPVMASTRRCAVLRFLAAVRLAGSRTIINVAGHGRKSRPTNGTRLNELMVWLGDVIRTTNNMGQQLQRQPGAAIDALSMTRSL